MPSERAHTADNLNKNIIARYINTIEQGVLLLYC